MLKNQHLRYSLCLQSTVIVALLIGPVTSGLTQVRVRQTVAKEYLEFEGLSLDDSLHQFLFSFLLIEESQERERIVVNFSERFFNANPDAFPSLGRTG